MTKSKLTLILGVVAVFIAAISVISLEPKDEAFKSVELGLAETSPLGAEGGFAIPASGDSVNVLVPKAKISDNKSQTYWGEEFKVTFGPKTSKQEADICELFRKTPNGNNWSKIETAGAGNTKSKSQSLEAFGTWHYRAHCGVEVEYCQNGNGGFNVHTEAPKPRILGLILLTPYAEANGGGGSNCKNTTYWGEWVYLHHPVVKRPPVAEISQNKATTRPNENFWLHYGPKTTGYNGGAPDTCRLQRRNPNQGPSEWVDQNDSNGNTKSIQLSPAMLGTWKYRARCVNDGGPSAWVSLDHLVVNSDTAATALIEVRNITKDESWTSEDLVIDAGDQIELRWASTYVNNCNATNFDNSGLENGTTNVVDEPAASTTKSYGISCTGTHGSASDSLSVSANTGVKGEVTVDPTIVRTGETVTVSWENAAASCSLTGPGLNMPSLVESSGTADVVVNGESTYTLTCPGGVDTATVKVLPVIQET